MSKIKPVNRHQILKYLLRINPERSERLVRLTRNVWQSDERITIDPLIWQMSLLTSIFYLAVAGGVIGTYPATAENSSKFYLAQANIEALNSEESIPQPEAIATEEAEKIEATTTPAKNLEEAIISELNRARTDPQGYADWLESQKQYYQGMFLKLPGEQPIRTNRGLQALEEAIAFLRQQAEIAPLSPDSNLVTTAQTQVNAIVNSQQINYQESHLVYGKVTPEAIVMQLIVDDGFPDRRHRKAVFQQDYQNAGIVCSEIAVYNQVCAIAYDDTIVEIAQQPATIVKPEAKPEETVTTDENQLPPPTEATPPAVTNSENPNPTELEAPPEVTVETFPTPEEPAATEDSELEAPPEVAVETTPNSASETETTTELEATPEEPASTEDSALEAPPEVAVETTPNSASETETTTELEQPSENSTVATTSTTKAEFIENGILEEGDDVIPNDGSFYDSYPLEGVAGESFIITLESQDFDTFLAVMDGDGNILEQNDDVNEQESNSSLEVVLPQDGTYNVIVNAYDREGKGSYTLKVSR